MRLVGTRSSRQTLQTLECPTLPSDLTDAEWALIEPCIPPAKRREIVNGLMYILSTGCDNVQNLSHFQD